jgi:hypothetical protein
MRAFRTPLPEDLADLAASLGLASLDLDPIEAEARASITR